MKESKFLRKEDCGAGILVTIKDCQQVNTAQEGAPEELKWCLFFQETEKPMVLNTTNATIIAEVLGSPQTENWTGKQIVLYSDPNVMYAGKRVGGIRARAKRTAAPSPVRTTAPAAKPVPQSEQAATDADADSIPF
jgi:hypothetical protein